MIKSFLHIILALSVFFSSSGFWINSHYCQNQLAKTSFFFNLGNCCEGEASGPCTTEKMSCSKEPHEGEKGCCHNKPSFHKLDQNQLIQTTEFKSFEQHIVLNAIIPAFNIAVPCFDQRTLQYFNYKPPLLVINYQARFETFLC